MIKLRIQGTKNDIRWFMRILEADGRYKVENTSTFFRQYWDKEIQESLYRDHYEFLLVAHIS